MNAKEEFLRHTADKSVKCAIITHENWEGDSKHHSSLRVNYTKEEYDTFLTSLDYNYDAGYGTQEVYGTIWYNDGTFSNRWEYDGSEGWDFISTPVIPEELN